MKMSSSESARGQPYEKTAASGPALSAPTNLTVNQSRHPLGIESTVHFGWDSGISHQTAYEIRVATTSGFTAGTYLMSLMTWMLVSCQNWI